MVGPCLAAAITHKGKQHYVRHNGRSARQTTQVCLDNNPDATAAIDRTATLMPCDPDWGMILSHWCAASSPPAFADIPNREINYDIVLQSIDPTPPKHCLSK